MAVLPEAVTFPRVVPPRFLTKMRRRRYNAETNRAATFAISRVTRMRPMSTSMIIGSVMKGAVRIITLIVLGLTVISADPSVQITYTGWAAAARHASFSTASTSAWRHTISVLLETGCGTPMTSSSTTILTIQVGIWLTIHV